MIYGFIHPGSGLGNMLHRYVATRVLALDKGYDFSMIGSENFKGKSFMNLDMGLKNNIDYRIEYPAGKIVSQSTIIDSWEEKTNYHNPEFHFVQDNTVIDGEFQSIQYFGHRLKEVDEWLKVDPITIPDDVCAIGFRGGEFYVFPELGLPKGYFLDAISMMKEINPNMRFEVHTDDIKLATEFFGSLNPAPIRIVSDISINWRSMRYAKYAIIANSSFYIFPRLLSNGITLAPRGWARRNIGEWSRPDNYYPQFKYV